MWFALGIVTLLCTFALSLYLRTQALWTGEPRSGPGGVQYLYAETYNCQGKIELVRIGQPAPDKLVFKVRREGVRDRFSKWIGLSVELQTSDAKFDRFVYLESDLHSLASMLRSTRELRNALVSILKMTRRRDARSPRICCLPRVNRLSAP